MFPLLVSPFSGVLWELSLSRLRRCEAPCHTTEFGTGAVSCASARASVTVRVPLGWRVAAAQLYPRNHSTDVQRRAKGIGCQPVVPLVTCCCPVTALVRGHSLQPVGSYLCWLFGLEPPPCGVPCPPHLSDHRSPNDLRIRVVQGPSAQWQGLTLSMGLAASKLSFEILRLSYSATGIQCPWGGA